MISTGKMRLPRRIAEVLNRKEAFLDELRLQMENSVIKLQSSLFNVAISEVISLLDVKDGVIQDTANNYRLISEVEKLYSNFNVKIIEKLLPQISKGITSITDLNKSFFLLSLSKNLPERFEKVIEATRVITDLKIGLRAGKMIRGGYLMSMLRTDPTEFKQFMSKAVTAQIPMKEFIAGIKERITGTEAKKGILDRQFQQFAYDTYQQYDRAYNRKMADEFGMQYFFYQGRLIKDSRDFCAAHYNKVWSIEETETWATWTPAEGQQNREYPEGYEIKAKDIYKMPSYLGYPGYEPTIDLGGYRCNHIYAPISDELAYKLRPELRK
jgi:hypothetical protein